MELYQPNCWDAKILAGFVVLASLYGALFPVISVSSSCILRTTKVHKNVRRLSDDHAPSTPETQLEEFPRFG